MAVLSVQITSTANVPNVSGQGLGMTQQLPIQIFIMTNDTLATVLTSGYLNESHTYFQYPYNNYQMALVYTSDAGCTWLRVSVTSSGGVYTYSLATPTEGSASFSTVSLGSGTAAAPSLNFTADLTTGLYRSSSHVVGFAINGAAAATLSASAFTMLGNLVAGASGTAGTVSSFPSTASKGSLALVAVANTGDTVTTISNVAMGQASTVSIPDPGSAAGRFLVANTATPFTSGNSIKSSGTGGLVVDAGYSQKVVKQAAVAGGAAAQTVTDAACATTSAVIATWNDTTNAVSIQKVVAGNGSFVVTSSGDPGASHLNYIIFN